MADTGEPLHATESTAITETTTHSSSTKSKKSVQKRTKNLVISEFSIRKPDWAYVHLQHITPPSRPNQTLDEVTVHLHLTAALSSFLGLHGTAIPIDILKLDNQDVWIRVPTEDRAALVAAVGGWMSSNHEGWRVKGWSHWNASCMRADAGQDLFN